MSRPLPSERTRLRHCCYHLSGETIPIDINKKCILNKSIPSSIMHAIYNGSKYILFRAFILFVIHKTSNIHHVQAFNMFMIAYQLNT